MASTGYTDNGPTTMHGRSTTPVEERRSFTTEESLETLLKLVNKYDGGIVKNWKEDIDTLLVFAGLFAAVVTAFAVESNKLLSQDSGDATVILLSRISRQLQDPNATLPEPEAFQPSPSSVRINCFLFLSLILGLISGLLALLCKQWLREHRRETPTRTPMEALALRQLRRDSLEKWYVPQLVATTPILLELALLLFFAGLLEFTWTRSLALFIVCLIAVGLGSALYLVTTCLPMVVNIRADLLRKADDLSSFRFVCPYKSSQAWAIYHFCCMVLRQLPSIGRLLVKRGYEWWTAVTPPPDWFFSDIRVLAAFDDTPDPINMKVYELRALDWATRMFQDSPSMVPHFQNIIQSLPLHPSVVISAVLNYWSLPIWETLTESDVQEELRDAKRFRESRAEGLGWYTTVARSPRIPDPGLHSDVGIQVLTFRQYWLTLVDLERVSTGVVRDLKDSIDRFKNLKLDKAIGIRFFVPFSILDALWAHPNPMIQDASLESLLPVCQYSWNSYPGVEEDGDERLAFMAVLIKHLQRGDTGRRSCLLTHTSGQEFIRFIHKKVIHHELYEPRGWDRERELRNMLMGEWTKATRSIPGLDPLPNDRPPAEGP